MPSGNDTALTPPPPSFPMESSICVQTSPHARAKRRIAALLEEVETLKQDKAIKQSCIIVTRRTTYYVSQGRVIRRMVALYTPIEDLVAENDRCCEDSDGGSTPECYCGFMTNWQVLTPRSWRTCFERFFFQLKRGADSARGDDTGTLKELVASWVNIECNATPLIRPDDKHHRGFVNDASGRLLCPVEWCWEDPVVRASIHDCTTAFIISENLWPSFLYETYKADANNLERGLFKLKLLVMGFKAIFTSPSSANKVDADGMRKVTPHAIVYAACQIRFALSNITSWCTIDGDFNYQIFWDNIVDFFEDPPGPVAQARVKALLEWWTRKVFGRNHQGDLTLNVISQMSVSSLAAQRQQMEDAMFD
ncbi:hypothetical protein BDR06DRAFT_1069805 [Suillus hirtellus]|nr:hypothetical protein BDR06DRAFT_1069805 [Suillus hirtellus]